MAATGAETGFLRTSFARHELERIGYRGISLHARGSYITVRLPAALDVSSWAVFTVNATRAAASARLHVTGFETGEQNSAALDVLRERYGERLSKAMPDAAQINWHGGSGPVQDHAKVELPGAGYGDGSANEAARWTVDVRRAWLDVMRADPIADLSSLVEDWVVHHEAGSADFEDNGEP